MHFMYIYVYDTLINVILYDVYHDEDICHWQVCTRGSVNMLIISFVLSVEDEISIYVSLLE